MCSVKIYTRANGRSPYQEFIEKVNKAGNVRDIAKIGAAVSQLAEKGSQELVKIELAEKMNDIWQLRPVPYRVFYFWDYARQQYVLLNGYRKKGKKADRQELRKAEGYRVEYLTRHERG